MEQLLCRHAKAIQILSARGAGTFNEGLFKSTSKEMLFRLYQKAIVGVPFDQDIFSEVSAVDFEFTLNGPGVANTDQAMKKLIEIVPEIAYEKIGRIWGGQLVTKAPMKLWFVQSWNNFEAGRLPVDGLLFQLPQIRRCSTGLLSFGDDMRRRTTAVFHSTSFFEKCFHARNEYKVLGRNYCLFSLFFRVATGFEVGDHCVAA
jgi:hypothetical protein